MIKKERYIRCKKCGVEIYWNTYRKMVSCKCGSISVDGCEDYLRLIGNKDDYEGVYK